MKILAIQGSPRKNGNTANLLNYYLKGIEVSHANCETIYINLAEKNIKPCNACKVCKGPEGKCYILDDMEEIHQSMLSCDVIVLASPIYWWSITGQAKQMIDRLYGLKFEKELSGKRFVLLLTYAIEEPNSGTKIITDMFEEICRYVKMDFTQVYGVCTGTVSVNENPEGQNKAFNLGKAL